MDKQSEKTINPISLVQKSNPLLTLYSAPYTLPVFKLLDTYLSRIDIAHPENREVMFERRELERIFGSRISFDVLNSWGTQLASQVLMFEHKTYKSFEKMWINLFDKAYAFMNEEKCFFVMRCSEAAMPLFFNIEHIGYIKYRLQSIMALTSRYTYLLFVHIERNRFRRSWSISVDDLRQELGCTEEYYEDFTRFSQKVLKRAQQELLEKASINISISPDKKQNRKVVSVKIEILSETEEPTKNTPIVEHNEDLPQWWEPLNDFGFTDKEKEVIKANLQTMPKDAFSQNEETVTMKWYRFLEVKAAEMKLRQSKTEIRDKLAYLITLIKNDIQHPPTNKRARNVSASAEKYLNRYQQREYTDAEMLEIERQMIEKSLGVTIKR